MKNKIVLFSTIVFSFSFAILATIYLAWLLYPLEISGLDLTALSGLSSERILLNFHHLMDYLTNPFSWTLAMPDLPSSTNGLHHFAQVKLLFHLVQFLFFLSLPGFVCYLKEIFGKGFGRLYRRIFFGLAVCPFLLFLFVFFIGFDQFFVLFHQVLFVGDSTWLFDPAHDPVILILPEVFFLHCFLVFFFLYELTCLVFAWGGKKRKD
ncbi:TIGR01906 family membrane protein [Streptococcus sp. DD13]|uniref:TIGR01906 family membrane protein n=1 Tax=Streptococcus sp. DD13 TaxID=1777881 RepID=UPI00079C752B|nr:TIGR01906 family membrane protein [Streptococcus sp. DD13]KXT79018.1 integral membrane protein [Streptococcus sp. DD13]